MGLSKALSDRFARTFSLNKKDQICHQNEHILYLNLTLLHASSTMQHHSTKHQVHYVEGLRRWSRPSPEALVFKHDTGSPVCLPSSIWLPAPKSARIYKTQSSAWGLISVEPQVGVFGKFIHRGEAKKT